MDKKEQEITETNNESIDIENKNDEEADLSHEEDVISLITRVLPISEEYAKEIVSTVGNDLEKVVDYLKNTPFVFLILCLTVAPKENKRLPSGAMFVVAYAKGGKIIEFVFKASRIYTPPPVDLKWQTFRKNVVSAEVNPQGADKEQVEKLEDLLNALIVPEILEDLYRRTIAGTITEVKDMLEEILSEELGSPMEVKMKSYIATLQDLLDVNISVPEEIKAELPDVSENNKTEKEEEPQGEPSLGLDEGGAPRILAHCKPIIDPASGIPITELQPGDKIEVEIVDESPIVKALKTFLEKAGIRLFPVIKVTKLNTGGYIVLIALGENSFGYVPVGGKLRIKGVKLVKNKKETSASQAKELSPLLIIIVPAIIGIILVFAALIYLLFK